MFNLEAPNGNFPYLVSVFNAQTLITPVAYETGTTLDGTPNGTGPWKLATLRRGDRLRRSSATPTGGAARPRSTARRSSSSTTLGTMVTAMQGGAVDALVQFSVLGGDALLNSPDFTVLEIESTTHRQIWMRCDTGQFVDKAVRQALAYTFDREQMVETLFQGRAEIGNDHVVRPVHAVLRRLAPPQRTKDIEMARQLLADAGARRRPAGRRCTPSTCRRSPSWPS